MWRIRMFFRKVKNLIRWFPIIWKDEDWDDHYIVEIFIKKLEHQRDFFLSDRTHILEAENVAAEIQIAIDSLRKTADSWEHYESIAVQELNNKWGVGTFDFKPVPGKPDVSELCITYPNVKTEKDKEQYKKEYKKAMKLARKKYKKDKRATYQFIADNIDKWWD